MDNNKILLGVIFAVAAGVGVKTFKVLKNKVENEQYKQNEESTEGP